MSYYGAGDYYAGGDYYAAGGIFGTIAGAIGGAVKGFVSGGPIGAVTGAVKSVASKSGTPKPTGQLVVETPVPGITGAMQRLVPGGASGYAYQTIVRKRRRMNVGNAKALRRAIRREQGFVKLARRALKGTGYSVVSKSSRRSRPISIHETGPGSVTVR